MRAAEEQAFEVRVRQQFVGRLVQHQPARFQRDGVVGIFSALLTFCSTISTVVPSAASRRSRRNTSATTSGDRPIDGSSIRMTLGRSNSARPTSSCFCSPPDSEEAALCNRSFTRGKSSRISGMRSCVVFMPSVMPPSSRFSHTDSCPNRLRPCGTKATPCCVSSSFGLDPVMSCPPRRMRPWRTFTSPNSAFSTVLLPAPLGPSSSVMLPWRAWKLRSLRIMNSP